MDASAIRAVLFVVVRDCPLTCIMSTTLGVHLLQGGSIIFGINSLTWSHVWIVGMDVSQFPLPACQKVYLPCGNLHYHATQVEEYGSEMRMLSSHCQVQVVLQKSSVVLCTDSMKCWIHLMEDVTVSIISHREHCMGFLADCFRCGEPGWDRLITVLAQACTPVPRFCQGQ
jgi:hypothetical protein